MIKFRIVNQPFFVHVFEVLSIEQLENHRKFIVDGDEETGNFEISITETSEKPVKIGDFVKYDVLCDEFRVIDLLELEKDKKLIRI